MNEAKQAMNESEGTNLNATVLQIAVLKPLWLKPIYPIYFAQFVFATVLHLAVVATLLQKWWWNENEMREFPPLFPNHLHKTLLPGTHGFAWLVDPVSPVNPAFWLKHWTNGRACQCGFISDWTNGRANDLGWVRPTNEPILLWPFGLSVSLGWVGLVGPIASWDSGLVGLEWSWMMMDSRVPGWNENHWTAPRLPAEAYPHPAFAPNSCAFR